MSRITTALIAVIMALLVGMWYMTSRLQTANSSLKEITQVANQQKADLENIQRQRVQAAELDIKVTQELANAKSEVDLIRAGINDGTKRLRLAASCPKLPEATATAGKPDATSPRLNDSVERDYLSLVERIRQSETMINGLQSYIRTQCLN
ncbi:lysis protein [Hafnia paralvei]|jgi:prophage endopeptidase|uniref:lysis protein n=1 Tax=Hafnia paralvei TaxID=546367 RepID=UPI003A0FDFA1